jgi:hypothetical protein
MRQSDGAELLGPNDPRSASIGVIYVDANDNRQSVLTAILTQDKFGREEVVVVLPENNRAFQRPVDFDGLRNMRRGLKSEIVFIAPSGPGPAQFARQRRFPVYSSPENFVQSLKIEAAANEAAGKKRGFLLRRKPKPAGASATSSTANGRIEQKPASPLPVNLPVPGPGEDEDITNVPAGPDAAVAGMAGAAAGFGSGALLDEQGASSTLENSDAGSPIYESTPASSAAVQSNPAGPNEADRPEDPGIIRFPPPAPRRPRTTDKLAVPPSEPAPVPLVAPVAPAQPQIPAAASPTRRGNTGKRAAVAAGGAAAGVGAASAVRTANGGGTPPTGSGTGGPGGGSGGPGRSPRRTRRWLAILLVVLTLMLIAAIAIASNILPAAVTTATVTITPISHPLSDNFIITAVTGTPHPADRQVQARILSATSVTGMNMVTSSGSIPGAQATGQLTFVNNSRSPLTFSSTTLTGTSGVPVSFNGPITVPAVPPASVTVTGFAVNVGPGGDIPQFDILKTCCVTGILAKNTTAFSGGQNPQAHAVVEQADIDAATNNLITMLKPGVLKDLKGQVRSNEAVVPNTLQCPSKTNFTRDHNAGAHAGSVTVSGTITCTEEVYDQQAALTMAANLLTAEALKDFGPNFALTGNIVKGVTQVTQGSGGNVNVEVSAEGVWVYNQFDTAKLKKDIAGMSKQDAINTLLKQPGVSSVAIVISNGSTTLPDAAHITIEINSVPGATGTPTITPGSPTVVPTPTTPPITPTQGLGG